MTINAAIKQYQATGCEVAFAEIYAHIYEGGRAVVRKFSRRYKLDELDVESMINSKLLDIATKFDGSRGKFKNAVYSAVRLGCIDLVRQQTRRASYETEVMYEDDEGNEFELYEVLQVAPTTGEDDILTEIQKKHDQRQLTAFLLSQADQQTTKSVSAYLLTDSYRQAAKQIGSTDKTVKTRIRKLAQYYDRSKFGDYYDYLSVPTQHVG
ncbi:RNA polymerase sigma factor [Sporosarcina sp. ITBMC105]